MKYLIGSILVIFSSSSLFAFSDDGKTNEINPVLEKKQMQKILEKMMKRGKVNLLEGEKIKREIASVKDEELESIRRQNRENSNSPF